MARIPEAVEHSERIRSLRFVLTVVEEAGPVEVARMLGDAGFAVNEAGEITEKIGECETCGLHCYVKQDPQGRFVCINCRFDEVEAETDRLCGTGAPQAGPPVFASSPAR